MNSFTLASLVRQLRRGMSFRNCLARFFPSPHRAAKLQKAKCYVRPWLESLEDRVVPAVTLSIPTNLNAFQGGTVAVPIYLNQLSDTGGRAGLSRADFAINYDATVFSVAASDVFLGTVPAAGLNWKVTA